MAFLTNFGVKNKKSKKNKKNLKKCEKTVDKRYKDVVL